MSTYSVNLSVAEFEILIVEINQLRQQLFLLATAMEGIAAVWRGQSTSISELLDAVNEALEVLAVINAVKPL